MPNDDAAEQYREYLGLDKGHVDDLAEEVDETCPAECESTNHEGYTHEEFEEEIAAPDAEVEAKGKGKD